MISLSEKSEKCQPHKIGRRGGLGVSPAPSPFPYAPEHIFIIPWTKPVKQLSARILALGVPFVVSCCKFLKYVILKTFNEIVLAFSSVESKTNILYVNINFTGNLLLGFGRYLRYSTPRTRCFHLFWALALTKNVFSLFTLTCSK